LSWVTPIQTGWLIASCGAHSPRLTKFCDASEKQKVRPEYDENGKISGYVADSEKDLDEIFLHPERYAISEEETDVMYLHGTSNAVIDQMNATFASAREAVKGYKDPARSWKKVLEDAWIMTYIDNHFRSGIFARPPAITKEEFQDLLPFFQNIEKSIVEEFRDKDKIWLNPVLGRQRVIAADADIIADGCIYDIKTVKRPVESVTKDYYQLLGYAALIHMLQNATRSRLSEIEKKSYQKFGEIAEVALIFPLHLQIIKTNVKSWSHSAQDQYINKILDALKKKSFS